MQPDIWPTLITLTLLEIILGVDSAVSLSLVVAKLPLSQRNMARKLGLSYTMIMRILLLVSVVWLSYITQLPFTVLTLEISLRTLILLGDELFLIYRAIQEIREELPPAQEDEHGNRSRQLSLCSTIVQIMLLDIVFSLDSVITAVSLSQHILIMAAVVMIAIGVTMLVAKAIGDSVDATPSTKVLALTSLLFVSVLLVANSLSIHIAKECPYFAISFSLSAEALNIIHGRRNKKVSTLLKAHEPYSH